MIKNITLTMILLLGNIGLFAQDSLETKSEIKLDTIHANNAIKAKTARDTISDNAIVYPESMTESLSDLLQAWQLDVSSEDLECNRGQNLSYHDTVYANRLYQLPTVMELSFNQVVKNYIEMYSSRRRDQVSYMLALGDYYFPMFEEALDRHGLPDELKYIPVIESALNPIAVSRAGATGLWQFMLRTGKSYGLEVNSLVDERRDPYKSTEAAVRYLKDLYAIYGDWNLVIAAYNCGPGNVNKAIARSGGKRDYWEIYNRLPRETRGYVPAFIAANYIMNHYADHNICPASSYATSVALDTIHVNEQIHFEQIAGVLNVAVSELSRLNPQYKSDRIPGDKTYALVLPSNKMFSYIEQNDSILNFNRDRYFTHRAYTDGHMDGTYTQSDGNTLNVYYSVKRGDNLSTIASRNGTTISRLKTWNGLNSDRLSVGKRLIVDKKPVPVSQTENKTGLAQVSDSDGRNNTVNTYYRVRKGDTLGAIAQRNSINVSQLRSWNDLKSSRIDIGDQLIVGQEIVAVEEAELNQVQEVEDIPIPDNSEKGSSIISDYLKEQLSKTIETNIDPEEEVKVEDLGSIE